jgi:hypothetical protein
VNATERRPRRNRKLMRQCSRIIEDASPATLRAVLGSYARQAEREALEMEVRSRLSQFGADPQKLGKIARMLGVTVSS